MHNLYILFVFNKCHINVYNQFLCLKLFLLVFDNACTSNYNQSTQVNFVERVNFYIYQA